MGFIGVPAPLFQYLPRVSHQPVDHNHRRFSSTSETLDQLLLSLENEEILVAVEEADTPETIYVISGID